MACQPLATHAIGVTHGNGAAVHIQQLRGNAQFVAAIKHLHRKGFVQFPQVDVLDGQAQTLQHLGDGIHRANAHFIGLTTCHSKTQESAQGLEVVFGCVVFTGDHTSACAIGKLRGIASRHHTTGHGWFDAGDALFGGAVTQALVSADRDLFGHHAHDLVNHASLHRDGCNFIVELASSLGRTGFLLAGRTVLVHDVTTDVVALGHLLGGLQHVPVNLGLLFVERGVHQHVLVHFLLHTRDALHATGHIHIAFTCDNPLRRQCNGLQTRRAKTIDGEAAHGDGAIGHQSDLTRDVGAGRALGVGATHDDVLDMGGVNAGTGDGVFDRVATQGGTVGHVESPAPAFGQRCASGGDDDSVGHDGFLN